MTWFDVTVLPVDGSLSVDGVGQTAVCGLLIGELLDFFDQQAAHDGEDVGVDGYPADEVAAVALFAVFAGVADVWGIRFRIGHHRDLFRRWPAFAARRMLRPPVRGGLVWPFRRRTGLGRLGNAPRDGGWRLRRWRLIRWRSGSSWLLPFVVVAVAVDAVPAVAVAGAVVPDDVLLLQAVFLDDPALDALVVVGQVSASSGRRSSSDR